MRTLINAAVLLLLAFVTQAHAQTLTLKPPSLTLINPQTIPALKIEQNGTTSSLLSGPAGFQFDNSGNTGAGFGIFTSAAFTGHPFQLYSTSVLAGVSAAYIQYHGLRQSLWIEHYGTGTNGNAFLVDSHNTEDSSLGVIGREERRGTGKIRHIDPGGDDHNASTLSLKNDGVTTEAQAIFFDCDSPSGTVGEADKCGKFFNMRTQGTEHFTMDSQGNSVATGEMRSYSARIEPITTYSSSPSIGGVLTLRNTLNDGSGFVAYTNNGASATGDLVTLTSDNDAFVRKVLYGVQDGTGPVAEFDHNGTGAGGIGLSIVSANPDAPALFASGVATGQGVGKFTHTGAAAPDDHNSAALVLSLLGTGTQSQMIFGDAPSGTTGPLINLRNLGADVFHLSSDGYLQLTSTSTTHSVLFDCNANTSSSTSVGGCGLLENTGNTGAGLVLFSANTTSTAKLFSARVSSATYGGEVAYVENTGTNNALRVVQSGSNAGANAILVSDTNASDSAVEITGVATSQPTFKVTHTLTSGDSASSVIHAFAAGAGTAARILFLDGVTTGNIIDARNNGTQYFTVDSDGDSTIGKSLVIGGTTGTFRPPKLTTTQRDALTPTEGDVIYNTTVHALQTYNGTVWL